MPDEKSPRKAFDKVSYDTAYAKDNLERHSLNLNRRTEADIIDHLRAQGEPFAAYVKRLIREDMARGKADGARG